MAGWRGSYGNRVKASETRREAFLASASPDEVHRAAVAHYVSQGTAERAAAFLDRAGRPGYQAKYCEDCDQGWRITK